MTRRAPGFARAFAGRWRITEMDEWDEIDLLGAAHITFSGQNNGELVFIAIEADLDMRYGSRDGGLCFRCATASSFAIPDQTCRKISLLGFY